MPVAGYQRGSVQWSVQRGRCGVVSEINHGIAVVCGRGNHGITGGLYESKSWECSSVRGIAGIYERTSWNCSHKPLQSHEFRSHVPPQMIFSHTNPQVTSVTYGLGTEWVALVFLPPFLCSRLLYMVGVHTAFFSLILHSLGFTPQARYSVSLTAMLVEPNDSCGFADRNSTSVNLSGDPVATRRVGMRKGG
jgi:hypothetical protein